MTLAFEATLTSSNPVMVVASLLLVASEVEIVGFGQRSDHRARRAGIGDERNRAADRDKAAHRAGKSEHVQIIGQVRRNRKVVAGAQSGDRDLRRDIGRRIGIDVDHGNADPKCNGTCADTAGKGGDVELLTRLHVQCAGHDHRAGVDGRGGAANQRSGSGPGVDLCRRQVARNRAASGIGQPGIAGHQLMRGSGRVGGVDGDRDTGLCVFVGRRELHLIGVVGIDDHEIGLAVHEMIDRGAAAIRIDHGIAGLEAGVGTKIDGMRGVVDGGRRIERRRRRIAGLHLSGERADGAVHKGKDRGALPAQRRGLAAGGRTEIAADGIDDDAATDAAEAGAKADGVRVHFPV